MPLPNRSYKLLFVLYSQLFLQHFYLTAVLFCFLGIAYTDSQNPSFITLAAISQSSGKFERILSAFNLLNRFLRRMIHLQL